MSEVAACKDCGAERGPWGYAVISRDGETVILCNGCLFKHYFKQREPTTANGAAKAEVTPNGVPRGEKAE